MNTYIKPLDLSIDGRFGIQHSLLSSDGYGDLNVDALWKWSSIFRALDYHHILAYGSGVVVELGGGLSPIHHRLSLHNKVVNVDLNFNDNWFPTEGKFYVNAQKTLSKPENITYLQQDFNSYASSLEPESVDLFIDSCSLIHFNKQNKMGFHNDGCVIAAQHMFTALKPGGYFISACDTRHPGFPKNTPEWLTGPEFVECYGAAGFEPVGPIDFTLDTFYQDPARAVIANSSPCHTKLTTAVIPDKSPTELLMYQANDGTPLIIGLYTFRKPL